MILKRDLMEQMELTFLRMNQCAIYNRDFLFFEIEQMCFSFMNFLAIDPENCAHGA